MDKFKLEYQTIIDKIKEDQNKEPSTVIEIVLLNLFRDSFYSVQETLLRNFIDINEFKDKISFINNAIFMTCKDLDINPYCICKLSITGEYFTPKRMPRRIDIEKFYLCYKDEFVLVRNTYDDQVKELRDRHKEYEENKQLMEYDYFKFD